MTSSADGKEYSALTLRTHTQIPDSAVFAFLDPTDTSQASTGTDYGIRKDELKTAVAPSATTLRYATVVIAAADSLHASDADFVCTGTGDIALIQSTLNAMVLPTFNARGRVLLMAGTYIGNPDGTDALTVPIDVTLEGEGITSTYLLNAGLFVQGGGVARNLTSYWVNNTSPPVEAPLYLDGGSAHNVGVDNAQGDNIDTLVLLASDNSELRFCEMRDGRSDVAIVDVQGGNCIVHGNLFFNVGTFGTALNISGSSALVVNNKFSSLSGAIGIAISGNDCVLAGNSLADDAGGNTFATAAITNAGTGTVFDGRFTSEPADASLGNSEWAGWLDDTIGTTVLNIKAKDSAGTVVTAQIALS